VEVWIGAYALIATVAIVLPTLFYVEQRLESSMIERELDVVSREERLVVETLSNKVRATETSLVRLARRVSIVPLSPSPADLAEFDRLVAVDADGAHRSRTTAFDPAHDAGIWIPRHGALDDAAKSFYVRAKSVIEDVAGSMDDGISDNAWVLVDHGGEIILWPKAPRFIYDAGATHDYSDTDWVRLVRPESNPSGAPRWTRVEFDPVPRVWMVSVIAPFTRDGAFGGSVGHDVPLDRLISPTHADAGRSGTTFMVIDDEGRLLASTAHAEEIREGRGSYAVGDLPDRPLRAAITRLSASTRDRTDVRRVETASHIVLGTRIPATNWVVISAIPRRAITARISEPIDTMRTATLVALGLVLAASFLTIDQDRRRRLIAMEQVQKSEEKFARAQKLEALGRFAGGIAHDFNNVLTVISGFAQVAMRRGPQDAAQRDHLEQIMRACQRAADLTKQLLAFARSQPLIVQVVDVNVLVRDTHKLLRRVIGEDVELVTLPSQEPANVVGDPGQLEQVLTNLAINARDAMPSGGTLSIRVETTDASVVLTVEDTGSGMSEEVLRNATEPFFTTKPAGRGTGLGLSTCQTIVEQMGGRMAIRSVLGRGTTFAMTFPITDARALPEAAPSEVVSRGHGELILLVEDDFQVRNVLAQLLKSQGFEVVEAENGADGLAVVRARHRELECIITDVVMPILGGGPFMAAVRREHPDLPIVVTSGYVDDPAVRSDLRDLDVDFLPKPFTVEALMGTLTTAMRRQRRASANAS
jgi:signal transduction histidine kinase/ActR/RegA family two-component response regulator